MWSPHRARSSSSRSRLRRRLVIGPRSCHRFSSPHSGPRRAVVPAPSARLLRTPAMHTQRAMPARCAPACGIRAPAVSGWPGGLVGLWVCGRLWSRATASRFVSALSQLNLSLSQPDLSLISAFISPVSQHGNPAIPAAFRANPRLSHGYLTAISRLYHGYLPAIPSSAIPLW